MNTSLVDRYVPPGDGRGDERGTGTEGTECLPSIRAHPLRAGRHERPGRGSCGPSLVPGEGIARRPRPRPWTIQFPLVLVAAWVGLPAVAQEIVQGPFLSERFFDSVESRIEKKPEKGALDVPLEKRTVVFLLEPWDIAQPRFRRPFKATSLADSLFFRTMGYNARAGLLEVPCILHRIRETKGSGLRTMPVMLRLQVREPDAWEAVALFRRRELRIELTTDVRGVRWEFRAQGEWFLLGFSNPSARLLRISTPWLSPRVELSHEESLTPEAVTEKEDVAREFAEPKARLRLELKAASFESIRLFADWEPDQKGWYGRDFLDTYGRDHPVAVLHRGREGASMWTTLPQSIPAGEYQVFLRPGHTRQRVQEHVVRVTLNGQTREFRWQHVRGIDTHGWIPAPVFVTQKPGRILAVQGIQVGGGGLGGVPEPPSWTTILDSLFITDDLELRSPDEPADAREEQE